MSFARCGVALGCVLIVAGCDFAPKYHAPVVAVPVSYKESGRWQRATPADTLPRGAWWRIYGDPLLDRLEAQLPAANPTLAAAVANYDAARALVAEIGAGLFPSVTLGGSATSNRQSAQRPLRSPGQPTYYGNNELFGQVNYEIDFWGRVRNLVAAGKASAQSTAADLASAQLSLAAELANDYLALRGLDAQAKLLADTSTAYRKALDITRNRFEGKIASGIDVARAATQLDTARAAEAEVMAQRALLEHAIASLVGKPASDFAITPAVVTMGVPRIPTGMPATLLQRRPDIAAAERLVAAANAQIGVARAAFYPNVNLAALIGFQDTGKLALLQAPLSYWTIGPQFAMPLFEGGLLRAALAASYAQMRQAAANYRAAVLAAFQQVEDDLALLNHLADEAAQENAAVRDAGRTLGMSMDMYQVGAVNYLDVTVAQEQLLSVQQTALSLQTRRLQASVQLIRALGGGWSADQLPSGAELTAYDPGR